MLVYKYILFLFPPRLTRGPMAKRRNFFVLPKEEHPSVVRPLADEGELIKKIKNHRVNTKMNKYEITYITKSEQSNPALEIIESLSGKIISSQELGLKKFAYPIAKNSSGYYFKIVFESESKTLIALEKKLKLNESVIRFLIVHKKAEEKIFIPEIEKISEKEKIEIPEMPVPSISGGLAGEEKEAKISKKLQKPQKIKKEKPETQKQEKERLKDLDKELEKILME